MINIVKSTTHCTGSKALSRTPPDLKAQEVWFITNTASAESDSNTEHWPSYSEKLKEYCMTFSTKMKCSCTNWILLELRRTSFANDSAIKALCSFQGEKLFSGIMRARKRTISGFITMPTMCKITSKIELEDFLAMLSWNASIIYNSHIVRCEWYEDSVRVLQERHNNADKCSRLGSKMHLMPST